MAAKKQGVAKRASPSKASGSKSRELVPAAQVEEAARQRIITVRDQQVVLDSDLAEFYGVETKALNQAVERNRDRFPEDFAFRLTPDEARSLRSQNVTSNSGRGGRRTPPRVFTEQGALAASGILRSDRAAEISVAIARAFVAMRAQLASLDKHPGLKELVGRLEKLEAGSKQQQEFNKMVKETLVELRPILDAVEKDSTDAT